MYPLFIQAYALFKAIEEGVSHMWTCSALQTHARAVVVCDEVLHLYLHWRFDAFRIAISSKTLIIGLHGNQDATLELKVKTVKYFKGIMKVRFSPALVLLLVSVCGLFPYQPVTCNPTYNATYPATLPTLQYQPNPQPFQPSHATQPATNAINNPTCNQPNLQPTQPGTNMH